MKTHKYHPHLWLKFLKCCSVNEKNKTLYQKMDKYKQYLCMICCLVTLTVLVATIDALGHFETG